MKLPDKIEIVLNMKMEDNANIACTAMHACRALIHSPGIDDEHRSVVRFIHDRLETLWERSQLLEKYGDDDE